MSFSSKLISSANPNKGNSLKTSYLFLPSIFNVNQSYAIGDLLSRSQFYSAAAGTTTSSVADSLKPDSNRVFGSAVVNPTSLAALSASKYRDVIDLAKHYGPCYFELSKARLRSVLLFSFTMFFSQRFWSDLINHDEIKVKPLLLYRELKFCGVVI